MWEKCVIFAQRVKFEKKAIWYLIFLGARKIYPSWVISVTEEEVVILESIVQVALADLWVGLPTFGAPMAIVYSSRIYSMLASSIFFECLDDYLCMFYWVNRRITLSSSLASLVDKKIIVQFLKPIISYHCFTGKVFHKGSWLNWEVKVL